MCTHTAVLVLFICAMLFLLSCVLSLCKFWNGSQKLLVVPDLSHNARVGCTRVLQRLVAYYPANPL